MVEKPRKTPVSKLEKEDLILRLRDRAFLYGIGRSGGIGYHTKRLKGRDREIMESLTSDDFNHRIF